MKFLLDENADARLAPYLRSLGFDVTQIASQYPASLSDAEVLGIATREGRIVITFDRDFGELIFRHGLNHAGVIYLRIGRVNLPMEIELIQKVLNYHADDLMHFLVVTPRQIRVRRARDT